MDASSVPQKRCSCCKNEFPATNEFFYNCKGASDGLRWQCKKCLKKNNVDRAEHIREYNLQYRLDHKDEIKQWNREYYFQRHDVELESRRENYKQHKAERLELNRAWRKANPEQSAKIAYIAKHRRRARKANAIGSHTTADIERIYLAQNGCCAYCDMPLPADKYHLDHIIPLSRGGSDNADNLTISCSRCNLSKGDKLLSEWEPPFPDELSLFPLCL